MIMKLFSIAKQAYINSFYTNAAVKTPAITVKVSNDALTVYKAKSDSYIQLNGTMPSSTGNAYESGEPFKIEPHILGFVAPYTKKVADKLFFFQVRPDVSFKQQGEIGIFCNDEKSLMTLQSYRTFSQEIEHDFFWHLQDETDNIKHIHYGNIQQTSLTESQLRCLLNNFERFNPEFEEQTGTKIISKENIDRIIQLHQDRSLLSEKLAQSFKRHFLYSFINNYLEAMNQLYFVPLLRYKTGNTAAAKIYSHLTAYLFPAMQLISIMLTAESYISLQSTISLTSFISSQFLPYKPRWIMPLLNILSAVSQEELSEKLAVYLGQNLGYVAGSSTSVLAEQLAHYTVSLLPKLKQESKEKLITSESPVSSVTPHITTLRQRKFNR